MRDACTLYVFHTCRQSIQCFNLSVPNCMHNVRDGHYYCTWYSQVVVNGHNRQSSLGTPSESTASSSPHSCGGGESYEAKFLGMDTYCMDKSHPSERECVGVECGVWGVWGCLLEGVLCVYREGVSCGCKLCQVKSAENINALLFTCMCWNPFKEPPAKDTLWSFDCI